MVIPVVDAKHVLSARVYRTSGNPMLNVMCVQFSLIINKLLVVYLWCALFTYGPYNANYVSTLMCAL